MAGEGKNRPRVAISLGDPLGIGPEVVARALAKNEVTQAADPVIFGDSALLTPPFIARCTDEEAAHAAGTALKEATDALLDGSVDALATAPLTKASLMTLSGGPFMGHTGYLAHRSQGTPLMTFVSGRLRVGLLSVHIPLGDVPKMLYDIGVRGITRRLGIFSRGLRQDLGIPFPRIAVLGVNPHAGEDGLLGNEEQTLIKGAIEAALAKGLEVEGPFPSDGYFAETARSGPVHDGILACYHDQGLIGFKALQPDNGAQVSLGLPIVRTSCQHGTAREIAGTETADSRSMQVAITLAAAIAERRRASH